MRLESLAVHAGAQPDSATGAVAPPLHLSTTFQHGPAGESIAGFEYSRGNNPTQQRLQQALTALEGGAAALVFASGMAAADCVLSSLPPESRVLIPRDVYHGVRTLAAEVLPRMGMHADVVDMTNAQAVADAMTPTTRCIWLETPSNPLLQICDIAAIADIAHRSGAIVVVDNTFATPCLQQPLVLGADIVMHSTTKYFGGHSDVMGGALIFARDDAQRESIERLRLVRGAVLAPFNAWLILRGLRSLPARMAWHCRNARVVAEFLVTHPRVEAVHWPGLPTHPNHAIAARQMRDFGAMLSVQIRGGREGALEVAGKVRLFINATSLGGCESLIEHRASVEGAHPVSPQNLLRLSVGIEHADDLVEDLRQALD